MLKGAEKNIWYQSAKKWDDFSEKTFGICFETQEGLRRAQVRVRTHREGLVWTPLVVEPCTDYIKCEQAGFNPWAVMCEPLTYKKRILGRSKKMSEVDTNNYCLLGLYHSPIPMYLNFFLSKVEINIFSLNLRNPLVRPQPSAMMVRLLLLRPPRCHTTALQGTIYPHGNRMPQSNYLEREGQLKSTRKIFALIREKAITVKRFRQTW